MISAAKSAYESVAYLLGQHGKERDWRALYLHLRAQGHNGQSAREILIESFLWGAQNERRGLYMLWPVDPYSAYAAVLGAHLALHEEIPTRVYESIGRAQLAKKNVAKLLDK